MIKKILLIFLLPVMLCAQDMTDNDGDGLPDIWEANFGLSTNSAYSVDGPYGDPDNDGLPNIAEYMAGYWNIGGNIYSNSSIGFLPLPNLSPTNAHSVTSGLLDRYVKPSGAYNLGFMFTDHDFIDDSWEKENINIADLSVYDSEDMINGWRIWDICREDISNKRPTMTVDLYYNGPRAVTTVDIYGYTDIFKKHDVKYTVSGVNKTHVLTNATEGALRQSTKYWVAMDSSTKINPLGVAQPFGETPLSWENNRISILMKDDGQQAGYIRTVLSGSSPYSIRRTSIDGVTTYARTIFSVTNTSEISVISEAHMFARGMVELDWGFAGLPVEYTPGISVYEIRAGLDTTWINNTLIECFTNIFSPTSLKAVPVYPAGGTYVYSSRPSFRWTMPDNYSAYRLEIKSGSGTGSTVYSTTNLCLPDQNINSEYFSKPPVYGGDKLVVNRSLTNGVYVWRVLALNAKFISTAKPSAQWSDWNTFKIAIYDQPYPSKWGSVQPAVKYFGEGVDTDKIRVCAFDNPGFSGLPESEVTLTNSIKDVVAGRIAVLGGLVKTKKYYLMAYLDENSNFKRDVGESWGYYNYDGYDGTYPFTPRPFMCGVKTNPEIVIIDADVNQNSIPDVIE